MLGRTLSDVLGSMPGFDFGAFLAAYPQLEPRWCKPHPRTGLLAVKILCPWHADHGRSCTIRVRHEIFFNCVCWGRRCQIYPRSWSALLSRLGLTRETARRRFSTTDGKTIDQMTAAAHEDRDEHV